MAGAASTDLLWEEREKGLEVFRFVFFGRRELPEDGTELGAQLGQPAAHELFDRLPCFGECLVVRRVHPAAPAVRRAVCMVMIMAVIVGVVAVRMNDCAH